MSGTKRKKVVVAMSGGVDSSVTAALLKQQGYDCIGVFMRLGADPGTDEGAQCQPGKAHHQGCCSTADAADARFVAGLLDIPFYALNFQHDFSGIIDYFVREYNAGRTPNPCVRCNEYLKFGKLMAYANATGADFVATGHYARIVQDAQGHTELRRGRDLSKDQSYVLFGVRPEHLPRMMLPLGDMDKSHVRELAEAFKLPVFSKPDSQEICFVPDNDYTHLIQKRAPGAMQTGKVLDMAGQVVGEHQGHQAYTIGQRKGVGIALGYPVYVVAKDPAQNTVTLGPQEALAHQELEAREVNWLDQTPLGSEPIPCLAKIRYNTPPRPARVWLAGTDLLRVRFDEPLDAITPGQAVVCYAGDRVLGGGWIDRIVA